MKDKAIYVSGMGVISALGTGVEAQFAALKEGRSGVGEMRVLNSVHREIPVGEVKADNRTLCGILGLEYDEGIPRTALLEAISVKEALSMAGLGDNAPSGIALISGTTVGGMDKFEQNRAEITINTCGCACDLTLGLFPQIDFATTVSTACSSAANALMFAADLIRTGRYEIVVAGGSECLSKFHLNGFNSLMILDSHNCRPFDAGRAGLNLGEGAGYLVLESGRSLRSRKAAALCEFSGYGNACDAFHQTASSPQGDGAFLSMTKALSMSGLRPQDISCINAHGTGTVNNDLSEGKALERVFGCGKVPPVFSTKAYTGHTTSASGGIEAVFCILSLLHDFMPKSLGFSTRIEDLSFEPVRQASWDCGLTHVLDNAFGFGGNDSSMIFSKISS